MVLYCTQLAKGVGAGVGLDQLPLPYLLTNKKTTLIINYDYEEKKVRQK